MTSIDARPVRNLEIHKAAVLFSLVTLLLLISFLVNQSVQAQRISRERDRAEQVSDFLIKLFQAPHPGEARGNQITVREMLDQGADRIANELQQQPLTQAAMMQTMGQVYTNLGLNRRAIELFEKALQARRQLLGEAHPDTAATKVQLARLLTDLDQAETLLREALAVQRKYFGNEHKEVAFTLSYLGLRLLERRKLDEAEAAMQEGLGSLRNGACFAQPGRPVVIR